MNAKYLVRQVVDQNGARVYAVIATALIFTDSTRGILLAPEWGGLELVQTKSAELGGLKLYSVKKAKPTRSGKVISRRVGEFLVRADGVTATLYLDLHDEPMAAYREDPKRRAPDALAARLRRVTEGDPAPRLH